MPLVGNTASTHFAFPDVCLTPIVVPTPITYPSFGFAAVEIPGQVKTFTGGAIANSMGNRGTVTLGDQGGVALGVASGMFMGPASCIFGSLRVFLGVMPVKKWLSPHLHNGTNMVGATLVPGSNFKWWVFS